MTVSIIIAVKTWQRNLEECVANCLKLDYPDFEIIVLPDEAFDTNLLPSKEGVLIRIMPTGNVSPAEKRDKGADLAKGQIIAFLDDDAYPVEEWLKKAVLWFSDPRIAAVGGPALTPPGDSLKQKAGGYVYSSLAVSGNFVYRYIPGRIRETDDFPSCNFIVRKDIFDGLGGFSTKYWPGEDTKLCLDISKKLGKKIIYDPSVRVYHHRRSLYLAHLKQISNYALHRGYFVKRYPQTSLKISYFLPSLLVLVVFLGGITCIFSYPLRLLYFGVLLIYLSLVFLSSIFSSYSAGDLRILFMVFSGIILTHITYGIYFIKGLFLGRLKEE